AGKMIRKVSIVNGTSGSAKIGSSLGSSPLSATVGTLIVKIITSNVTTTIATNGAGIVAVTVGHKKIITRPRTNSGYTAHGTSIRSGSRAIKIRIASELTNPVITDCGIKRMSLATPINPSTICKTPARMTVANKYGSPCEATIGAITSAVAA